MAFWVDGMRSKLRGKTKGGQREGNCTNQGKK